MDEQQDVEGSSWRSDVCVARLLDGLGAGMDVTTIVVPVLTGSPVIAAITGLLALGLHSAARWRRRR
ncbi:hypothetical protein AB0425_25620 [Actinosynnema sp. NPDC051121]